MPRYRKPCNYVHSAMSNRRVAFNSAGVVVAPSMPRSAWDRAQDEAASSNNNDGPELRQSSDLSVTGWVVFSSCASFGTSRRVVESYRAPQAFVGGVESHHHCWTPARSVEMYKRHVKGIECIERVKTLRTRRISSHSHAYNTASCGEVVRSIVSDVG